MVAGQTVFPTYGMDFHSGQRIESSASKNIDTATCQNQFSKCVNCDH